MELHRPGRAGKAMSSFAARASAAAARLDAGAALGRPGPDAAAGVAWSAARPRRRARPIGRPPSVDDAQGRLLVLVLIGAWVGTAAMAEVLPSHGEQPRRDRPARTLRRSLRLDLGRLLDRRDGRLRAPAAGRGEARWRAARGAPACGRSTRRRARPSSCRSATSTCRPSSAACRRPSNRCAARAKRRTSTSTCSATRAIPRSAPPNTRPGPTWPRSWPRPATATAPRLRLHYRWRQLRTKRKAGNVADFCRRWGAAIATSSSSMPTAS